MKDIFSLCDDVRQTAYMKGSRLEHGLLINFGSYKFQIKKYVLTDSVRRSTTTRLASLIGSFFFAFSALFRG